MFRRQNTGLFLACCSTNMWQNQRLGFKSFGKSNKTLVQLNQLLMKKFSWQIIEILVNSIYFWNNSSTQTDFINYSIKTFSPGRVLIFRQLEVEKWEQMLNIWVKSLELVLSLKIYHTTCRKQMFQKHSKSRLFFLFLTESFINML